MEAGVRRAAKDTCRPKSGWFVQNLLAFPTERTTVFFSEPRKGNTGVQLAAL